MNQFRILAPIIAAICVLVGCANENPNLVNPPPGLDSIYVRFINFSEDQAPRSLSLESAKTTAPVGFAQSSAILESPLDSARLIVYNGQTAELTTPTRVRFTRSSFITVVATPSVRNASVSRPFDTIIVLNTLAAPPSYGTNDASVRICNVSPDSNSIYSIKLGCQNGTEIARDAGPRSISAYRDIPSGQTGVTLTRNDVASAETDIIGLYSMTFEPGKSYTFFVCDDASGNHLLLALDDRAKGGDALRPLAPITERAADMQIFNFTRRELSAYKVSNGASESVAANLAPLEKSASKQVSACGSLTTDQTIALTNTGDTAGRGYFALEVLRQYAVFWFDLPASANCASVILRKTNAIKSDSAAIIVVNGAFSQSAITASLGARTNSVNASGYSSGEILCSRLGAGVASSPAFIAAGDVPVTLFSPSLPARLLMSATAAILPGKKYYLIIRDNAAEAGGVEASLVEDSEAGGQTTILQNGAFVQAVNASSDNVTIGFDRILSGAKLPQYNAIATILPVGQRSFFAGNARYDIQASKDSASMIIIAGQSPNPDIFAINTKTGASRPGFMRRRYINAASDINGITIVFDSSSSSSYIAENIAFRSFFDEPELNYERKISVYFLESATKRPLDSMQNVRFTLGKNYSLILTGGAGKYRAITQQEF